MAERFLVADDFCLALRFFDLPIVVDDWIRGVCVLRYDLNVVRGDEYTKTLGVWRSRL